jgi:hypothetical protein
MGSTPALYLGKWLSSHQTKFVATTLQTWHGMPQLNTIRVQSMQVRGGHSINQDIIFKNHMDLHC